jgi:hypothetical protein
MKLKRTNALALKVIEREKKISKSHCARILNVSPQAFHYRIKNSLLTLEEIKMLRLPIKRISLRAALEKDLKSKR